MLLGIGPQERHNVLWRAALGRDAGAQLWMPLLALKSIPFPTYVGVDNDPTGWRFEVLRAGWQRWLDGIGLPLPPIRVGVRADGTMRIADGNHRLTTARERGLPVCVQPVVDDGPFEPLFGWRVTDDAGEIQTLSEAELAKRMHAPSVEAAAELREQLVACIVRRRQKTGEDFTTAARAMFSTEGQALAVKFDRSAPDPSIVVGDLVRGLQQLPTTIADVRDFVLAHQPPDEAMRAHYAKTAISTLQGARDMLGHLIRALEGER